MRKMLLVFLVSFSFLSITNAQSSPQDSTLQEFVGRYKFPDGSVIPEVVVRLENGALTMSSSAGTSDLTKKGEDLYEIVAFTGTAKFNRDANKKIVGVSIDARGYQLEGVKTDGGALSGPLKNKFLPARLAGLSEVR
jgi:hypothetical protein